MEIRLQTILFPNKEEYRNCERLFFKSTQSIYDDESDWISIAKYSNCDFFTYLNAFSNAKWKKYTGVKSVNLRIHIKGTFLVTIVGYHTRIAKQYEKTVYFSKKYNLGEKSVIEIPIPDNKETLVGFEIKAITDCFFYSGEYYTEVEECSLNHVTLSIAITTFKKEEFVKKNLKMIKEELLSNKEIGDNIFVHIVDNGRTLDRELIEDSHVFYHPNKNVGGSGGFSRGMLESVHQKPRATHVLLMDDDVEILSEAIRKTYVLLQLLKDEYKDYFISGAMLRYEQMDKFYEDIGVMCPEGHQDTLKGERDLNSKKNILFLEEYETVAEKMYAGWWYCCIPVGIIIKAGYSLPLFVRGDDTEYSLRNQAQFITMNGICVWHMGFDGKFNYFMIYYQTLRNLLIMEACNRGNMQKKILDYFMGVFGSEILQFNYQAASVLLDAVKDYLKGPGFIEKEECQDRLIKMTHRNAILKDLNEYENVNIDYDRIYAYDDRNLIESLFYKLTFNGHLFVPSRWLKEETAVISYDMFYNPQRHSFRKSVLSVNPYTKQGELRKLDKNMFKKLMKEYRSVMKAYRKKSKRINEDYYNRRKYLVSEEFWRKYLEIEKYQ